ncbi:MAG: GAF domain-containing protein [Vulcanimicrobiota bacterium]
MKINKKEIDLISSLVEISTALYTVDDMDSALDALSSIALKYLKVKGCSIKVLNERRTRLEVFSMLGMSQTFSDDLGVYGMYKSPLNQIAIDGDILIIEDIEGQEKYKLPHELNKEGIKAVVCVPIRIEDKIIGVMSIYHSESREFDDSDMAFIKMLSVQAATVINTVGKYERTRSLLNVAKTMNSSLNLDQILKQIVSLATKTMRARASSIRLLNKSTNRLVFKHSFGLSMDYIDKIPVTLEQSPIDKEVLETKDVVYIEDMSSNPRVIMGQEAKEEGLASMLCVPMVLQDETIGIFKIYTTVPASFNKEEVQFLKSMGELGAIAIKNASLYEKLHSLYQVTSSLTATLETESVLDLLSIHAADYLSAMGAQVLIWSKEKESFSTRTAYHLSKDVLESLRLENNFWSVQETLKGNTIIVSNMEEDERPKIRDAALNAGIHSMVSVPIKTMDRVSGILQIYCKRPRNFTSDEIEFLIALANHGAIALENAFLHEKLQAEYDKLVDDIYLWHDWTSYVIRE